MAFSASDIAALEKAIATGVKSAEFRSGDTSRRQEFRSQNEMYDLLARMKAEVYPATQGRVTPVASHSRD